MNLADDRDEETRRLYLTACLLAFYQQVRALRQSGSGAFRPFLIERPLWILVGSKVTAVRTEGRQDVSDVVDVLLFLAEFIHGGSGFRRPDSTPAVRQHRPAEHQRQRHFQPRFTISVESGLSPAEIFTDILKNVFNAATVAALHVDHLTGSDGEIALRLGENNEPFGVINVGDAPKLCEHVRQASRTIEGVTTKAIF